MLSVRSGVETTHVRVVEAAVTCAICGRNGETVDTSTVPPGRVHADLGACWEPYYLAYKPSEREAEREVIHRTERFLGKDYGSKYGRDGE